MHLVEYTNNKKHVWQRSGFFRCSECGEAELTTLMTVKERMKRGYSCKNCRSLTKKCSINKKRSIKSRSESRKGNLQAVLFFIMLNEVKEKNKGRNLKAEINMELLRDAWNEYIKGRRLTVHEGNT